MNFHITIAIWKYIIIMSHITYAFSVEMLIMEMYIPPFHWNNKFYLLLHFNLFSAKKGQETSTPQGGLICKTWCAAVVVFSHKSSARHKNTLAHLHYNLCMCKKIEFSIEFLMYITFWPNTLGKGICIISRYKKFPY